MAAKEKYTTIAIYPETKKKIAALGSKGETFDEILNRLLKGKK